MSKPFPAGVAGTHTPDGSLAALWYSFRYPTAEMLMQNCLNQQPCFGALLQRSWPCLHVRLCEALQIEHKRNQSSRLLTPTNCRAVAGSLPRHPSEIFQASSTEPTRRRVGLADKALCKLSKPLACANRRGVGERGWSREAPPKAVSPPRLAKLSCHGSPSPAPPSSPPRPAGQAKRVEEGGIRGAK